MSPRFSKLIETHLAGNPLAGHRHHVGSCRTVDDSFGWCRDAIRKILSTEIISLSHFTELFGTLRRITVSTCFSGIGAPEMACSVIESTLRDHFRRASSMSSIQTTTLEFEFDWACEWSTQCQNVLLANPHFHGNLFGNVLDFLPSKLKRKVDKHTTSDVISIKDEIIYAPTKRKLYCHRNGKHMPVARSMLHIAGSPCVDHTTYGKQEGLLGEQIRYLWAWCAMIRTMRPAICVHENVPGFPETELTNIFADLYVTVRVRSDPEWQGWASTRKRVFDIFILKALISTPLPAHMQLPNLSIFEGLLKLVFTRGCNYDWTAFLFTDIDGIDHYLEERAWASKREHVTERHQLDHCPDDGSALWALTLSEMSRWKGYCEFIANNTTGDIGQEPTERPITSGIDGKLPTLMKGQHLHFFSTTTDEASQPGIGPRWVSNVELLESLGYPIRDASVNVCCGASHAYSLGEDAPYGQSHSSSSAQTGNTQHVNSIGAVLFMILLLFNFSVSEQPVQTAAVSLKRPHSVVTPPPSTFRRLLKQRLSG